jgi:hypothetical protein
VSVSLNLQSIPEIFRKAFAAMLHQPQGMFIYAGPKTFLAENLPQWPTFSTVPTVVVLFLEKDDTRPTMPIVLKLFLLGVQSVLLMKPSTNFEDSLRNILSKRRIQISTNIFILLNNNISIMTKTYICTSLINNHILAIVIVD